MQSARRVRGILCQDLDSQNNCDWDLRLRRRRHEQPFARTDFDLQRLVIAEQGSAGQDLRQIIRVAQQSAQVDVGVMVV